jgi:hypothetical protein
LMMIDALRVVFPLLCTILGIMSLVALINRKYGSFIFWSLAGVVSGAATLFLPASGQTSSEAKPSSPVADAPAPAASSPSAIHVPWELLGFVTGVLVVFSLAIVGIIFVVPHIKKNSVTKSENIRAWEELVKRHEDIRNQWASYETDMSKLIDLPLMTDMREPVVIDLHKALKTAASLAPKSQTKYGYTPIQDSAFFKAVNDLEVAFRTAEQTAKKVAWSRFTDEERRSLSTAKKLLSLAVDSGASPAERQAAYRRVFKELQGLIEFPEKARFEIESRHQLSLTAA